MLAINYQPKYLNAKCTTVIKDGDRSDVYIHVHMCTIYTCTHVYRFPGFREEAARPL